MGEMILCRQPIAAEPYYIEDVSLNIYSIEELCYYIVSSTEILDGNFMSPELCNWLGRQLGMKDLETGLLDSIQKGESLHRFVEQILESCGYLTRNEIKSTVAEITAFENQSTGLRKKIRGDRLMEKNRVVDAIYEYEGLLSPEALKEIPPHLAGDIWHNLGTAYARLYFFSEAAVCYEQAYLRNHRRESLRQLLYSLRCNKKEDAFYAMAKKYMVPEREVEGIISQTTGISHDQRIRDFGAGLDRMHEAYDSRDDYFENLRRQVLEWEDEYKQRCRI